MKRIFSLAIAVILLLSLCACAPDFDLTAEAEPYIAQMMTALSAGDADAAAALLHPDREDSAAGIQDLIVCIDGRTAKSCAVQSLSINTHTGTGGKVKTESGTALVTLEDGAVLQLQYVYQTTDNGAGFTAFRFMLGV